MNVSATIEKMLAGRWIAGYYASDALERTRTLNGKGISAIINYLGEDETRESDVRKSVSTYIDLAKSIRKEGLDASISLKATEIGLSIGYKRMESNYMKIVTVAKRNGVFVWLDMESPETVDDTITAYKKAMRHGNTGICIQAYLKRSLSDANMLIGAGGKIRLVKGAYTSDPAHAFGSKRAINSSYREIMAQLFKHSNDFMIATHDSKIIDEAILLNRRYKKRVTYAMLNGIRNKYAKYLAGRKHRVSIYLPFGSDWLGYGIRRLREEGHISLVLRSLFEDQSI